MIKIRLVTNNPTKTVIVPEQKTVRQVLEENNVNYQTAVVALSGMTLAFDELDQPLSDFGVGDETVISALARKNNAAKAKISGSAVVITSDCSVEDLQKVKKYHPEALCLYDENKEPTYAVDIDSDSPGSINMFGATFSAVPDSDGKATITVLLEPGCDRQEVVYDKIGRPLMMLSNFEKTLPDVLAQVAEEDAAIREAISLE